MNDAAERQHWVVANLPIAGLGNKLLVWARALVFAQLNNRKLLVSPWFQPSVGAVLRRERQSRFYVDQLRSQGFADQIRRVLILRRNEIIEEPAISALGMPNRNDDQVYLFRNVPHWSDYFSGIKDHRDFVKQELQKLVARKYIAQIHSQAAPSIALHIRMGDYRKLRPEENFSKVGLVRTPLDYFVHQISMLRRIAGKDLPVTVFSDGNPDELSEITALPNVSLAGTNPAVVDIFTMAKSKVIVLSAGSTFGMWGAFLSDAAIIHHPDHYHAPVRSPSMAGFEGCLPEADYSASLVAYLKSLGNESPYAR